LQKGFGVAGGDLFRGSAGGEQAETVSLREREQARSREVVQNAGRAVFVPAAAEEARGPTLGVPGFDEQVAAGAQQGADDFHAGMEGRQVADDLDHGDQVKACGRAKVFERGGVDLDPELRAGVVGHALVRFQAGGLPSCGAEAIHDEASGEAHVEQSAGRAEGPQDTGVARALAAQQGGFSEVIGVSGAPAEKVRVVVNGADVGRGRDQFGEAMMTGGATADGMFAGSEDWRARSATNRAGEWAVCDGMGGWRRHFES